MEDEERTFDGGRRRRADAGDKRRDHCSVAGTMGRAHRENRADEAAVTEPGEVVGIWRQWEGHIPLNTGHYGSWLLRILFT